MNRRAAPAGFEGARRAELSHRTETPRTRPEESVARPRGCAPPEALGEIAGRPQPASRTRRASARALLAALAAATALSASAQLPVGPPIELNVSPRCSQSYPAAAHLASGEIVTAWIGPVGDDHGVAARIAGWPGAIPQPLSDELLLDDGSPFGLLARGVALAAAGDGGFYAAWWGPIFEPVPTTALVLRAFDSTGQPVGDPVEAGAAGGPPVTGAALAVDPQGRPAVAWRDDSGAIYLRLFESDLTPRGGLIVIAGQAPGVPARGESPGLAIAADGSLLIAWAAAGAGDPPSPHTRVLARRVAASGSPAGTAFEVNDLPVLEFFLDPAVAALEGGRFAVLWSTRPAAGGVEPGIYGRLLDADGAPDGAGFPVASLPIAFATSPDVAPLAGGGFLAAWSAIPDLGPPLETDQVFLRVFGPEGTPGGPELAAPEAPAEGLLQSQPAVTADAGGRAFVAWREHYQFPPILVPPCIEAAAIVGQPLLLSCTPTGSRLCLQGGRFAVEVTVDDPRLGPAFPRPAGAEPLTADTGTFWFFRPANVELMTKVLDGRAVNGRFWFFSGALSNVGHEIVVTDTLTGEERRYENLPGELTSRADTTSFFDPPPPPASGETGAGALRALAPAAAGAGAFASLTAAAPAPGPKPRPLAGATHPVAPCSDPAILCLHGGRIQVRLDWTDPRSGDSGSAVAMPLSNESGWFWFFRADNAEAVVKVLDGWPVNDYFWVFFGGLTDLELTISVDDVLADTGRTYHNPPFTLTSFADTRALPGPFPCPVCSAAEPAPSTRSAHGNGTP
jgi:hypothetical protein